MDVCGDSSRAALAQVFVFQFVSPVAFGGQITPVRVANTADMLHACDIGDAQGGQIVDFFRVVGEQPERFAMKKVFDKRRRVAEIGNRWLVSAFRG